jgi:hypothetical protein
MPIAQTKKDMKGSGTKVAASTTNEIATSEKMTNGFMTPNKKHIASSTALATLTMEGIETAMRTSP